MHDISRLYLHVKVYTAISKGYRTMVGIRLRECIHSRV